MRRALFILTIFLSSGLLFLVQPLIARMLLPAFGGSPAVWTASNLFFQAFLLLGYTYAHLSTKKLGVGRQPLLHLPLMTLAALSLPFALPAGAGALGAGDPTIKLLSTLGLMIGFCFFCISAGAPLIQRWFSVTSDPDAKDPYFLYSASNLASLVALLSYPFLLEGNLRLGEQSQLWAAGYLLLLLMMGLCGYVTYRSYREPVVRVETEVADKLDSGPITWRQRLLWAALAAVPSSMLLGVTAFMTTNVAPVPLLWVIPLSVYLVTYILAFARHQAASSKLLGRIAPMLVIPLGLMLVLESDRPLFAIVGFHLIVFFVLAWMCHARLNESRPAATRLTEFYVWISLGGVVGGLFNAVVAPLVFNSLSEYPIAIVLALMLRPKIKESKGWKGYLYPVAIAAMVIAGSLIVRSQGMEVGMMRTLLTVGFPLVLTILVMDWPVRFALSVGAVLLVSANMRINSDTTLVRAERSFFGVHRVTQSSDGRFFRLLHGNTIHGMQDRENPRTPLTYYHPTGPIGNIFTKLQPRLRGQHVALVGLGVGSLASYGQQGQRMTYFEIDPVVRDLAYDEELFTFLRDSQADVDVVLGDARLTLAEQPDGEFELIVLDAFSSDSIPIHLLTVEAFEMYLRKLKPDGLIAVHISNRYLDLEPPLAGLGRRLKLDGLTFLDAAMPMEQELGKTSSLWVVFGRDEAHLAALASDPNWSIIRPTGKEPVWTDDHSNVLDAFRQEE